jgi:hypothetical protein
MTVAVLPIISVVGLLILGALAIRRKSQNAAMAHRERLAMIERGLVPPPELSEVERTIKALGVSADHPLPGLTRTPHDRFRSMGVTTIGIGLSLMMIIGVAGGSPRSGIGTGGAIAILGVAMVVNAYLDRGRRAAARHEEQVTLASPSREEPPPI